MSNESLKKFFQFEEKYPKIAKSLWGGDFCTRDIQYPSLSFKEVTKQIPIDWVQRSPKSSVLVLQELNSILEEDLFPWEEIMNSANRHFDNKQDVREWVIQLRDIFKEELEKHEEYHS